MKIKAAVISVLLLAASVFADYTIHIYHPWATDPVRSLSPVYIVSGIIPGMASPGVEMKAEGGGWFSYTFSETSIPASTQGLFYFMSYIPSQWDKFTQGTFYYNGSQQYNASTIFPGLGTDEIWIKTNGPSSTPVITDVPQTKYVVMLFNPWPENSPMHKAGSATVWTRMKPAAQSERCGWYGAYFMDKPAPILFKSIFGTQTYGSGGMGTATPIDLASFFSSSDTVFVVPDSVGGGAPQVLTKFPIGTRGICDFKLAVTVRDFSKEHPDFEDESMKYDVATLGMVTQALGPDNKPVRSAKVVPFTTRFGDWFKDNTTDPVLTSRNHRTCKDLPMSKTKSGLWGYDSYNEKSHSYFPIDDFNPFSETNASGYQDKDGTYKNEPPPSAHNFHFCMEFDANFKYKKGQEFKFRGDDDVWVYINKQLVIDLGGPHPALEASVKLDTIPGLVEDKEYPFHFFFCERRITGSNLLMETSIFFVQRQQVYAESVSVPGKGTTWDIFERTSGDKSCGSGGGGDVTQPAKSRFTIRGPGLTGDQLLDKDVNFGGVFINTAKTQVSVDTNLVTGLVPGQTYIIFYTSEALGKGGQVTFKVPGSLVLRFKDPQPRKEFINTPVGITIEAIVNGAPGAEIFRLTPMANLRVFADSAMKTEILPGQDLKTDATTGLLKVFVTSGIPGTYSVTLLGGLTRTIPFGTYQNLVFEEQKQVTPPTSTPGSGPFLVQPLAVTLNQTTAGSTILYTTDGTDPDTLAGGKTLSYSGPLSLPGNATIKARAIKAGMLPSTVATFTFNYTPPAGVKKAWYADKNGDGRIETVVIEFDKALSAAPAKLAFNIIDQKGANETRNAAAGEIAQNGAMTTVTLAAPFTFGITSVTNPGTSGTLFSQPEIPILAGTFAIDDSVAPVIIKADVKEPDSTQPLKRIFLVLSENSDLPLSSQSAVIFKRQATEYPAGEVKLALPTVKTGDRTFTLSIDTSSNTYPIVNDSVALNPGEAKDLAGNTPTRKRFEKLDGETPKAKPMDFFVTFPNSSKETPSSGAESTTPNMFIPVGSSGAALPGNALDGKCNGCVAMDGASMVGPVFHIVTPGAVEYEFKIFNNVGEFLAGGKGRIDDNDLPLLQKKNDASGIKYIARIVWTGRTIKGEKAGTGAYILQTTLIGSKDMKTGAPPGRDTRRVVFGMLRSFRG